VEFTPLAHGSTGVLDEVLEFGGLLLVVLLVYFFNAARKRGATAPPAEEMDMIDEKHPE
jgi:hypothetical protein